MHPASASPWTSSSQCQRYEREKIRITLVSCREHWNGSQETRILVLALALMCQTKDLLAQVARRG